MSHPELVLPEWKRKDLDIHLGIAPVLFNKEKEELYKLQTWTFIPLAIVLSVKSHILSCPLPGTECHRVLVNHPYKVFPVFWEAMLNWKMLKLSKVCCNCDHGCYSFWIFSRFQKIKAPWGHKINESLLKNVLLTQETHILTVTGSVRADGKGRGPGWFTSLCWPPWGTDEAGLLVWVLCMKDPLQQKEINIFFVRCRM